MNMQTGNPRYFPDARQGSLGENRNCLQKPYPIVALHRIVLRLIKALRGCTGWNDVLPATGRPSADDEGRPADVLPGLDGAAHVIGHLKGNRKQRERSLVT